ncbi:GDSL esterase/lipase At4g26790-like [Rutidosis leptorrhynchoides]|uniref:GDSL esterase/lipase At4g26790-like n=1 Tax=Rutidosis leptorrhynchoides TaxID=125765 RepID=UPI003A9A12C4
MKFVILLLHIVIPTLLIKNVDSNSTVVNKIKAMYVLGDSTVDCGENTLFFPFLLHNLSLHPCDGPPSSILPHLLAKKIGLPYPIPFYSQNGSAKVLLRGVNLGSTGATILSSPTNPVLQSLNQQLRQAYEIFQLLQLELGQETANDFIKSSTIFYISFGKDDYIDLFHSNPTKTRKTNAENLSQLLVDQMTNAIQYLYGSNVRKFLLMGVPPLGCTPRFMHSTNDSIRDDDRGGDGVICADDINNYVLEYNAFLEQRIVRLNMELVDAQLIFCDTYRAIREIINNPYLYGIENVKSACCGTGTETAIRGCMSLNMACEDPSTYVWWDLFNPGRRVSSLIADSAWSGEQLSDICRPTTVQKFLSLS